MIKNVKPGIAGFLPSLFILHYYLLIINFPPQWLTALKGFSSTAAAAMPTAV